MGSTVFKTFIAALLANSKDTNDSQGKAHNFGIERGGDIDSLLECVLRAGDAGDLSPGNIMEVDMLPPIFILSFTPTPPTAGDDSRDS